MVQSVSLGFPQFRYIYPKDKSYRGKVFYYTNLPFTSVYRNKTRGFEEHTLYIFYYTTYDHLWMIACLTDWLRHCTLLYTARRAAEPTQNESQKRSENKIIFYSSVVYAVIISSKDQLIMSWQERIFSLFFFFRKWGLQVWWAEIDIQCASMVFLKFHYTSRN